MKERDIAVGDLGARVKVILFPKGEEYCIADREANDDYCRQRLAVVSLVSLDLEGGCVGLSVAVGGTKDYDYHSRLAEAATGRKVSRIHSNTLIPTPEDFSHELLSVRGWTRDREWTRETEIGVFPVLKKRRERSRLTIGETRLISSGVISVAVAAVIALSSDEFTQVSEQGLELSAEEIRGFRSDFKCSIYDT